MLIEQKRQNCYQLVIAIVTKFVLRVIHDKFHNNANEAEHREDRLLMQTHFKTLSRQAVLRVTKLRSPCW